MNRSSLCLMASIASACSLDSSDLQPREDYGTLELPLTTELDGALYTLAGTFDIVGPEHYVLETSPNSTDVVLRQLLEPGYYDVTLADFRVWRGDVAVDAQLLSNASQKVEIRPVATTRVDYRFEIEGGDTVEFGPGELEIRFAVQSTERIELPGNVYRVVTSPDDLLFGLDSSEPRIWEIDVANATASSWPTRDLAVAACLSPDGTRLYAVEGLGATIAEYSLPGRQLVREVTWNAPRHSQGNQYEIYCGAQRIYLIDAQWAPGLWTLEGLEDSDPTLVDRSSSTNGLGALVWSANEAELFFWHQYGWNAGSSMSYIIKLETSNWTIVDQTDANDPVDLHRNPLDTPILLDSGRGLLFAKNRVVRTQDVNDVVYLLVDEEDGWSNGAVENIYAVDPVGGHFATRHWIYDTDTGERLTPTKVRNADQYWFAADGNLHALVASEGAVTVQNFR